MKFQNNYWNSLVIMMIEYLLLLKIPIIMILMTYIPIDESLSTLAFL